MAHDWIPLGKVLGVSVYAKMPSSFAPWITKPWSEVTEREGPKTRSSEVEMLSPFEVSFTVHGTHVKLGFTPSFQVR